MKNFLIFCFFLFSFSCSHGKRGDVVKEKENINNIGPFEEEKPYSIEEKYQKFYRHNEFIMCEQEYLRDESDEMNDSTVEEKSKTEIKNGQLYKQGNLVDTHGGEPPFVMNQDGVIYTTSGVNHSFFLKSVPNDETYGIGRDVSLAGHIAVKNGKITFISNGSGHYLPNEDQVILAVKFLHEKNILDPNVKILVADSLGSKQRSLDDILKEDSARILNKYPKLSKVFNKEYVEMRHKTHSEFMTKVQRLREQCPKDLLSEPVSLFFPNFKIPQQVGRIDFDEIELDGKYWRVFLETTKDLPIKIFNASIDAFKFSSRFNSTDISDNIEGGIKRNRGACEYLIDIRNEYAGLQLLLLPIEN